MTDPLVSVAVITYGMERYLPALLDSVLRQRADFPYEVVADDDFSPDGSRGIILDYAARFLGVVVPSLRGGHGAGGELQPPRQPALPVGHAGSCAPGGRVLSAALPTMRTFPPCCLWTSIFRPTGGTVEG